MLRVSELFLVLSVPCLARNIKAEVDCYSQVALVDWQASDGALLYEVVATAASGHSVACETNSSHCELDGLLCGQRYSVSVRAAGHTCSSVGTMEEGMLTGNRPKFRFVSLEVFCSLFIELFCTKPMKVISFLNDWFSLLIYFIIIDCM